ncbi:MAG TPA: small metal-binding protein SmbP [Nitrospirales bacterium]|nr:small metal-binding protein SmbP [Nitrospirales bacterium]
MQQNFSRKSFITLISMTLCIFSFLDMSFGKTRSFEQTPIPPIKLVKDVQENPEPYIKDVHQQLQKSRALLNDLKKMRTQASSQKKQEDLYAPIMKLTKELEHAERISKNLDVIDPQPWLRNKTEMDAVLADLEVTYDETLPLLQDRTRFLQDAVHHAKIAMEYGGEGRKDLFHKNALAAKKAASLAQKEGVDSAFVKEGISELEDALSHIKQDRIAAAATLTEGAYLHLNSALKKSQNSE